MEDLAKQPKITKEAKCVHIILKNPKAEDGVPMKSAIIYEWEPWRMTQNEFIEELERVYEEAGLKIIKMTELARKFRSYYKERHKNWVKIALENDKSVPWEVLADYNSLCKKFNFRR